MADEKRVQAAFINYVDEDGGGNLAMRGDSVDMSTLSEKEQKRLEEAGAFEGQEQPAADSLQTYYNESRAKAQREGLANVPEGTVDPETGLEPAGPPDPDEDEENEAETDMENFGSVETGAERAAEEEGDNKEPAPTHERSKAASAPASTQGTSPTA